MLIEDSNLAASNQTNIRLSFSQADLGSTSAPELFFSISFAGHDPTSRSGHGVFKMSRVGSGRVKIFQSHGWGRVGSGGGEKLTGRVGSGHDPRETITRGSDQHDSRAVFC